MKYLAVILAILCTSVWGYNVGAMSPAIHNDNFDTSQCDEIIGYPNYYTNEIDQVCEIKLSGVPIIQGTSPVLQGSRVQVQ